MFLEKWCSLHYCVASCFLWESAAGIYMTWEQYVYRHQPVYFCFMCFYGFFAASIVSSIFGGAMRKYRRSATGRDRWVWEVAGILDNGIPPFPWCVVRLVILVVVAVGASVVC